MEVGNWGGSAWMVTAIGGDAIMPMFMGWMAEQWSMQTGFLMPLICFVCIALYGILWPRLYRGAGTGVKMFLSSSCRT
jgi:FHS family L-fucose permease-like MFS transporter